MQSCASSSYYNSYSCTIKTQQHAQLNKYCGDPTFLERVEALTDIKSGYFIGCNLEEKSKPITGMRRNELVDVRGWGRKGEEGEGVMGVSG